MLRSKWKQAPFAVLAAQSAAERTERERAAVEQERLTIGRELQDIIAHSVSVMVVQAGGARRLLREEPDRARESILHVLAESFEWAARYCEGGFNSVAGLTLPDGGGCPGN